MEKSEKIGGFYSFVVDDDSYEEIVNQCFNYAIISLPFTVNRMEIALLSKRILNITKGKIAEKLLELFLEQHKLAIDFNICQTPFYKIDLKDFVWRDVEWDLKNNFLHCTSLNLSEIELEELPALIPNKNQWDQWAKRDNPRLNKQHKTAFIFSFMVGSLNNGPLNSDFLKINLSQEHERFLMKLWTQYQGKSFENIPFNEADFWTDWHKIPKDYFTDLVELGFKSPLYITSFAGKKQWHLFNDYAPTSFCHGKIKTRIQNKGALVKNLPTIDKLITS